MFFYTTTFVLIQNHKKDNILASFSGVYNPYTDPGLYPDLEHGLGSRSDAGTLGEGG